MPSKDEVLKKCYEFLAEELKNVCDDYDRADEIDLLMQEIDKVIDK